MKSPLAWLAVAAAGLAAFRAGTWAVRPKADALGRRRTFPVWSVGALAVLAVTAAYPPVRIWRLERRLSTAATAVAGVPTVVRCQGLGGALVDAGAAAGHVNAGADGEIEPIAHVDWDVCRRLRRYIGKNGAAPTADEVIAVHVVTHEARHVAGARAEAEAECQAVQRNAATAQELGASEELARALAQEYWRVHYPRMRSEYVSAECTPGGALDESLPTAPWLPANPSG